MKAMMKYLIHYTHVISTEKATNASIRIKTLSNTKVTYRKYCLIGNPTLKKLQKEEFHIKTERSQVISARALVTLTLNALETILMNSVT